MNWREWQILCPGPSLADAVLDPDMPTVAVNDAILREGIEPALWCCLDAPNEHVHDPCRERVEGMSRRPVVMTMADAWDDWGLETMKPPRIDPQPGPRCPEAPFKRTSMFAALLYCEAVGAQRVTLYGVDLEGVDFYGGRHLTKNRLRKVQSRWVQERRQLQAFREYALAGGMDVRYGNEEATEPGNGRVGSPETPAAAQARR